MGRLESHSYSSGGGGGDISGSGANTQIAYFTGTNTIASSPNFTWDGQILLINSTTGGIGVNAVPNANAIATFRRDQAGSTRFILDNSSTDSNAAASASINSDAGGFNMTAASVAGGAIGTLLTDSGFTGGLRIGTNGANPFEIQTNNTLALAIDASQVVNISNRAGIEAGPGADTILRVRGQSNTGANQWGLIVDTIHQSDATSTGYTISAQLSTAAAAFTMAIGAAFQAPTISKGAGSTITRAVNFLGVEQTAGTNNAFLSDNQSFSGNWFIYSNSTRPSHLSSYLEIEANADPGAPTDAVRLGSKVTTDSGTPNTFAFRTEQAVATVGVVVPTHIVRTWWNNVEYYMFLATV